MFRFLWLCLLPLLGFGQGVLTKPKTLTPFTLSAVDDHTSASVPARFTVWAHQAKQSFTGNSPSTAEPFSFTLTRADTLTVQTNVTGYQSVEEVMVVTCDTCSGYDYVVRMEKENPADTVFRNLQLNQAFQLDKVYFDQSSYVLRPESYPQLDKLVKTLAVTPKLRIEIGGHTDNVGDRRLNQLLSEQRARIIRNYLVSSGIPENRLMASGYGDTHPAAPNDSEENKRKNRRVEFVVVAM